MRINTFIVILLITFIICNNNNHIKGEEKIIKGVKTTNACIEIFKPFVKEYKEITEMTPPTTKVYVNLNRFVQVDPHTSATPKYTYYSFPPPEAVEGVSGQSLLIGTKVADFTMTSGAPTGVKNYKFPWNEPSTVTTYDIKFGSTSEGKYEFQCKAFAGRNANLLADIDVSTLSKYENIDPFMESFPETRTAIGDADIGEGVMLSRVDTTANRNYNIFLSKTQFCHFSCKIDNTECDLLVYETANYKSKVVNLASIIGYTGTPKSYKEVKGDTVVLVDTCAGDGAKGDECTKPQYTVISKGTEKKLTGYYKDEKTKYLVSASPPKIPAGIYAKFPTYIYCIGEPGVQGVSNMFINSILLILIVILMI